MEDGNLEGQFLENKYSIKARLHEGGNWSVYLATDELSTRDVIFKLCAGEGVAERFESALADLRSLDHPHLAKALGGGRIDGAPYGVFQLLPGDSLAERGVQSAEDVQAWLPQIASALDYMHGNNVFHGGVRPGRIRFDEAGNAVLVDPRLLAEAALKSAASDQVALAATVYGALTGEAPGDEPWDAPAAVRKGLRGEHETCVAFAEAFGAPAAAPVEVSADEVSIEAEPGPAPAPEPVVVAEEPARASGPNVRERLASSAVTPSLPIAVEGPELDALPPPIQIGGRRGPSKLLLCVGALLLVGVGVGIGTVVVRPAETVAQPPVISIASPAANFATRHPAVHVQGTVSDPEAVVTVGGAAADVGPDGRFTAKVQLKQEGHGAIEVVARSRAGLTSTARVEVHWDLTAPTIRLTNPAQGETPTALRAARIDVRGTVSEANCKITVAGQAAAVDAHGGFTAAVTLKDEGEITIPIAVVDAVGNEATLDLRLMRDTTPPKITIRRPVPGADPLQVADGRVGLSGSVDDTTAQVTVAGKRVALAEDGSFRTMVELEEPGLQAIEVVAMDAVGNASRTRAKVDQTTALSVEGVTDGMMTRSTTLTVRGRAFGRGATVTLNGAAVETDATGAFETTLELGSEGLHRVEVVARHPMTGASRAVYRVVHDRTAPQVTLDDAGSVISTTPARSVVVSGTVLESNPCSIRVNGRPARFLGKPSEGCRWTASVLLPVATTEVVVDAVDEAGNTAMALTRPVEMPTPRFDGLTVKEENAKGHLEYTLDKDPTLVLVLVPERSYRMGAVEGDPQATPDEKPAHAVRVGPFFIGKAPVTWAQYGLFCEQTGSQKPVAGLPHHPATDLTWDDALAYCRWAGLRLPREAEWERAARADMPGRIYPWGNVWKADMANVDSKYGNTTHGGAFEWSNEFGLVDVVGNIWEWCEDWYVADYYARSPAVNPFGPRAGEDMVVRGGSWRDDARAARLSARAHFPARHKSDRVGFRVARGVSGIR